MQIPQLAGEVDFKLMNASTASNQTDVDPSGLDMQGWDGVIFLTVIGTANAGNYLKAQESSDNSSFADLAGSKVLTGHNADLHILEVYKPMKRYIKPFIEKGGAATTTEMVVAIRYSGRKAPVVNTVADVKKLVQLISPAAGTP